MHHFVLFLVLQLSWQGSESWLLCLNSLPGVFQEAVLKCSVALPHGAVVRSAVWDFLFILTYFFVQTRPDELSTLI